MSAPDEFWEALAEKSAREVAARLTQALAADRPHQRALLHGGKPGDYLGTTNAAIKA